VSKGRYEEHLLFISDHTLIAPSLIPSLPYHSHRDTQRSLDIGQCPVKVVAVFMSVKIFDVRMHAI